MAFFWKLFPPVITRHRSHRGQVVNCQVEGLGVLTDRSTMPRTMIDENTQPGAIPVDLEVRPRSDAVAAIEFKTGGKKTADRTRPVCDCIPGQIADTSGSIRQ